MSLPIVVIVGRPNVGKSSLLNALSGERISIVDPRPGTTRDRVSAVIDHEQRYFEAVDTGGIGIVDVDHLEQHVEDQIRYAVAQADVVVFVVDSRDGLTALDQVVAERLRKLNKPVVVVANKVDDERGRAAIHEFNRLGHGEPLAVSALHGRGRRELLDRLVALLGDAATGRPDDPVMKLAIVGKRNAGKSTLVNALAGEERVIVSETPGTTRDAVDVRFDKDGRSFVAIDTAGVRKKRSMDDLDFYSYTRALRSLQRADVVLLLIDATVPVSEVDVRLASAIQEACKPVVIAVNKWDLAKDRATADAYGTYLTQVMPSVAYAPIVFITATTGKNIDAAVDVAIGLHRQTRTRVATAALNAALQSALEHHTPSPKRGTRPVKIYYATQVSTAPPTIVLFCNVPDLVTESYRRFLEKRLREVLPFAEVPLRLLFRPRHERAVSPE
jgi:GTP-binding protein